MSGGRMSSGSALRVWYLARRIVAVADGLIVTPGIGVSELAGGRFDAPGLELAGEAPGTVTVPILLRAGKDRRLPGPTLERAPSVSRGPYPMTLYGVAQAKIDAKASLRERPTRSITTI